MTRKLLYLFSFVVFLAIASVINQSCGNLLTYKASICDIEFTGNLLNKAEPDTLTDNIIFIVTAYPDKKLCFLQDFSIIQNCYATTKCAKWQNELLPSSFKISLDKELVILNDTIPANTDLFT